MSEVTAAYWLGFGCACVVCIIMLSPFSVPTPGQRDALCLDYAATADTLLIVKEHPVCRNVLLEAP